MELCKCLSYFMSIGIFCQSMNFNHELFNLTFDWISFDWYTQQLNTSTVY